MLRRDFQTWSGSHRHFGARDDVDFQARPGALPPARGQFKTAGVTPPVEKFILHRQPFVIDDECDVDALERAYQSSAASGSTARMREPSSRALPTIGCEPSSDGRTGP